MMNGSLVYLLQDAVSRSRRDYIYARAGTPVTIIADHGNVMIVEDSEALRFPVARSLLSADPVKTEHIPTVTPSPTKTYPSAKKRKTVTQTQTKLL